MFVNGRRKRRGGKGKTKRWISTVDKVPGGLDLFHPERFGISAWT